MLSVKFDLSLILSFSRFHFTQILNVYWVFSFVISWCNKEITFKNSLARFYCFYFWLNVYFHLAISIVSLTVYTHMYIYIYPYIDECRHVYTLIYTCVEKWLQLTYTPTNTHHIEMREKKKQNVKEVYWNKYEEMKGKKIILLWYSNCRCLVYVLNPQPRS